MKEKIFNFDVDTIQSLLVRSLEQYPGLNSRGLGNFFESLPREKASGDGVDVQPGDILIRRQYGHHEPAWYGVVEFIWGNEAYVFTPKGRKKARLSNDGQELDWELRRLRPEPEPDTEEPYGVYGSGASSFEEQASRHEEGLNLLIGEDIPPRSYPEDYALYQAPFGRPHVPALTYSFKCKPDPPAVPAATLFPKQASNADGRIELELGLRGLTAKEINTFKSRRKKGFDALRPIARNFGAAFGELLDRLRYSKEWLLNPPFANDEHRGFTRQQLLGPRLLLAIPDHFRELARRTTDPVEAFSLECLGWLVMYQMREEVKAATSYEWWIPPKPAFVTPFPAIMKERQFGDPKTSLPSHTPLDPPPPIVSKQVFELIKLYAFDDPSITALDFQHALSIWAPGLPGQFWLAETGQLNLSPGMPFYPSLIQGIPNPCSVSSEESIIKTAWAERVADVNRHRPRLAASNPGYKQRLKERINRLNSGRSPRSVSSLIGHASLGSVRLAYYFPALNKPSRPHRTAMPRDKEKVLNKIVPLIEKVFATIGQLGWNDLAFQSQGAFLFRGIGGTISDKLFDRISAGSLASKEREALKISQHAFGRAIDLNPYENPRTNENVPVPMHPRIVALMEAFGLTWGYCFTNIKDRHHFEYRGKPCPPADTPAPAPGGEEAFLEQTSVPYGGYDLRFGDKDSGHQYGGAARSAARGEVLPAAGSPGFVSQLQTGLQTLGFLPRNGAISGVFDIWTEQLVREFQIHAKMGRVARQSTPPTAGKPYSDSLASVANTAQYMGEASGIVNANTRAALQAWLGNNWRCPVVVEAWDMAPNSNTRSRLVEENLWRHHDLKDDGPRMFSRDFSDYYSFPVGRPPRDRHVLGYYNDTSIEGPISKPPNHSWPEAEILPNAVLFPQQGGGNPALSQLTAEQRATFKVIRAVSEVECYGFYDAINAWDDVFVSVGPFHSPIGRVDWPDGGELGAVLSYFEDVDPGAYHLFFGFFGIKPDKAWNGDGAGLFSARGQRRFSSRLKVAADSGGYTLLPTGNSQAVWDKYHWFRSWHWFYRFAMAGRASSEFQRALWDYARIRLRELLQTPWDGNMTARDPDSGMQRLATVGDFYTSERAVALILRWFVRFPGHMASGGRAGTHLREAFRRSGITLAGDPLAWNLADESALVQGIFNQIQHAITTASDEKERKRFQDLHSSMENVRFWPRWAPRSINPDGGHGNYYHYVLDPSIGPLSMVRRQNTQFPLDHSGLPSSPAPPRLWVP